MLAMSDVFVYLVVLLLCHRGGNIVILIKGLSNIYGVVVGRICNIVSLIMCHEINMEKREYMNQQPFA
jgi:hypothetical protein